MGSGLRMTYLHPVSNRLIFNLSLIRRNPSPLLITTRKAKHIAIHTTIDGNIHISGLLAISINVVDQLTNVV